MAKIPNAMAGCWDEGGKPQTLIALPTQRFLLELLETDCWTKWTLICPCRAFFFLLVLEKGIFFFLFSPIY